MASLGYCWQRRGIAALTMGFGDVAAIKQKAEAGDAKAQVALGNALVSQFRSAEALCWYSKAAAQGNVEGQYHVGEILLFGRSGIPATQKVTANSSEGIRWTFMAATNFHPYACQNMAKALESGIGVSTNLVEAYAWWQLFADTGSIIGRVSMNEVRGA